MAADDGPNALIAAGRVLDIAESGLAFVLQAYLPVGTKLTIECDGCILEAEVQNTRMREYAARPEYIAGAAILRILEGRGSLARHGPRVKRSEVLPLGISDVGGGECYNRD